MRQRVQPAPKVRENISEQGQLYSSSSVAGQFCINAGSFHCIMNLLVMDKTQSGI